MDCASTARKFSMWVSWRILVCPPDVLECEDGRGDGVGNVLGYAEKGAWRRW